MCEDPVLLSTQLNASSINSIGTESKYLLTKKTMDKYNSHLFAVGDDWQSIYSFSGSKIEYIYNITKYMPGIKIYNITKTYRNPQELINCAGTFILKNPSQNPKKLISDKTIERPIIIKEYSIVDENGLLIDIFSMSSPDMKEKYGISLEEIISEYYIKNQMGKGV